MSVIVAHPGGPQNVRMLLSALEGAGELDRFVTSLGWSRVPESVPAGLARFLSRRAYAELPQRKIKLAPMRELVRQCFPDVRSVSGPGGWASVDAVYHAIDRALARRLRRAQNVGAIYCYDDGALASFEAAAELGIRRVYELSAPYWRTLKALSEEEAQRQPEWCQTLPALLHSTAKEARKERELALASEIVVASRFARTTLEACTVRTAPVSVIPYGSPAPAETTARHMVGGPLRLLYVGNLNQQKGLSYLLDAIDRLGHGHTLTLVGKLPKTICTPLAAGLKRHRYVPPVGHHQVLDLMSAHDVLVFPTLFDGFGLVILEAMSRGLPVIATTNCAAPDIIDDGEDGYVVPIRDADALADRIERIATEPGRLHAMREAALTKAAAWSWQRYQAAILEFLCG